MRRGLIRRFPIPINESGTTLPLKIGGSISRTPLSHCAHSGVFTKPPQSRSTFWKGKKGATCRWISRSPAPLPFITSRSFVRSPPSRCFSFPFCFSLHLLHSRHFLSLLRLSVRPPLSPLLSPKRDRANSEAGEEKYAGEFGKNELKGEEEEEGI